MRPYSLQGSPAAALSAAAWLIFAGLSSSGAFGQNIAGARQFPDTHNRIAVFADQFPFYTDAQAEFAATHYVGTQKMLSHQIDWIRQYNPDFLHLQYRLGYRISEPVFIHNNAWTNDAVFIPGGEPIEFPTGTPVDDGWFVQDQQGNKVYNLYAGSVKEYIMNLDNADFRNYYVNTVSSDIVASHADGWFADSLHLPYAVPVDQHDSAVGAPPHASFIDEMERFYDHIYPEFHSRGQYLVPNIGNLVTTLDTTSGYYEDVHGAMVEGFATRNFSDADWRLQMNRTLELVNNDKIFIAQRGASESDVVNRVFILANYLLVKGDLSYINMAAPGLAGNLHWWPEYDLDLGAPIDGIGIANITELDPDGDGVYIRTFENGLVYVNGSSSQVTVDVDPDWLLMTPSGGGAIGLDGQWLTPGELGFASAGNSITLNGRTAAIFLLPAVSIPEPDTAIMLALACLGLLWWRRRGQVAKSTVRRLDVACGRRQLARRRL